MEHASIAAFARFCLQLMQLGAPSDLLRAAQRALADETVHAELAFDLASGYAAREVSAGALPLAETLLDHDAEAILRLVIHEGCLGETVAALEAVEAAAHCTVPEVSDVLERIAEDERNHAALAWRFVAWAVATRPALREVAEQEFEHLALGAAPHDVDGCSSADLRAHGVLPDAVREELRRAALEDVVLPCSKRVLASNHADDVTADVRQPLA